MTEAQTEIMRHLLIRCHKEIAERLCLVVAQQEAVAASVRLELISGGLIGAGPTDLENRRERLRLVRLLRDLEAVIGSRPPTCDPWVGQLIDDERAAA